MRDKRLSAGTPYLPLRPPDFLLLTVLQDGPLHGYALSKAMDTRSDGVIRVRPGDLYRVLYRLTEQALVEPEDSAGPEQRHKTRYRITKLGRDVLRLEAQRLGELAAQVLEHPKPESAR